MKLFYSIFIAYSDYATILIVAQEFNKIKPGNYQWWRGVLTYCLDSNLAISGIPTLSFPDNIDLNFSSPSMSFFSPGFCKRIIEMSHPTISRHEMGMEEERGLLVNNKQIFEMQIYFCHNNRVYNMESTWMF